MKRGAGRREWLCTEPALMEGPTVHRTELRMSREAVIMEERRIREAELEAKRLETERLKAENATVVNPNTSRRRRQNAEKLKTEEKAAAWEREHAPEEAKPVAASPSEVGKRKYARGRAYDPNRFKTVSDAAESTEV